MGLLSECGLDLDASPRVQIATHMRSGAAFSGQLASARSTFAPSGRNWEGMSATLDRPEVAVVRHPIADGRNNVVGYELRFGGAVDLGDPSRDAKATSALLIEAFGDIGLERLAGRHPAWVSIARNFLVEIGPPPVRPDRAVLQIDAYPAQDDLLGLLQQLSRSGYTLSLGDYDGR